ncbi:MAG: fimbrillin family protein [Prevotella sp.]|nr:fimbrillin family protein [Prevotella sp.]
MKRKKLYDFFNSTAWLMMAVVASLCITGCADPAEEPVSGTDDDGFIKLNFTFGDPNSLTRFWAPDDVSEVYIYGFAGRAIKANNLRYYRDESDEWVSLKEISWPARNGLISLYGLTASFNEQTNNMATERSFTYKVSNENNTAKDEWFGSTLNTTKTESDASVNMHFTRLLSIVNLVCNNSMQTNTVVIRKVILHNLVSAAKFTYHETINGRIEYSLLNEITYPQDETKGQWANYTYDMSPNPIRVPPLTRMACSGGISNSESFDGLILIPQKTNMWVTADSPDNKATSVADGLQQSYIELVCQIIDQNGNYVWGHDSGNDQWESVYIPLNKTWKQGKTVSIPFDMADIRAADGGKFSGHAGNQITFDNNFEVGVDCDVWEWDIADDEEHQLTF